MSKTTRAAAIYPACICALLAGRFGIVYKAELSDKELKNPKTVAAKTVAGIAPSFFTYRVPV